MPSLFIVTLSLKPILSDISMALPVFYWFLFDFHFEFICVFRTGMSPGII